MTRDPDVTHLEEDALVLHHFGEDEGEARERARRHLAGCEVCRDQLEQIRDTLELVASAGAPPAPDGFERVMWARLSTQLDDPRAGGWRAWFTLPRLAVAGGVLALVLAAFVAGRSSRPPETSRPSELLVTLSPETARRLATEDHLERAQMVLVEVLHAEADDADLAGERTRAADLVAANRLIRLSLAGADDATAEVLEDLERVLVEFANRGDRWSSDELEAFKVRLDAGGILFRLRVVAAEARQRAERRAPPVT